MPLNIKHIKPGDLLKDKRGGSTRFVDEQSRDVPVGTLYMVKEADGKQLKLFCPLYGVDVMCLSHDKTFIGDLEKVDAAQH